MNLQEAKKLTEGARLVPNAEGERACYEPCTFVGIEQEYPVLILVVREENGRERGWSGECLDELPAAASACGSEQRSRNNWVLAAAILVWAIIGGLISPMFHVHWIWGFISTGAAGGLVTGLFTHWKPPLPTG